MKDAAPQQTYQVRFDSGLAGFQALAEEADVVILVDALPSAGDAPRHSTALGAHRVIGAGLTNRSAVADWVLARQAETGERFAVAVIAAGDTRPDGSARFAVEDFLAAGAVVDALSTLGIDHCSPEAAAASAAFVGLGRALRHLVSASESGLALATLGRTAEVAAAARLDDSRVVPELVEFAFPA